MWRPILGVFLVLVITSCSPRSVQESEEDASVVSVYTTPPTTVNSIRHPGVYEQIANNIGEKITSPIYRFFGISKNNTEPTTKLISNLSELLEDTPEKASDNDLVQNRIDGGKDVEELSADALLRENGKPEKIVLYSSYLPVGIEKLVEDNRTNELDSTFDDDDFNFDDVEMKPRESGFFYFLEFMASLIELAKGALAALFSPRPST